MCMGGADFQTSSQNLTGFGNFGTSVQSVGQPGGLSLTADGRGLYDNSAYVSGPTAGVSLPDLTFGQTYGLASGFGAITKGLAAFKSGSAQKQSLMLQAQVQQANAQMIAEQKKNEKKFSKKERDAIRRKYNKVKQGIGPDAAANNLLLGGGSPLDALLGADIYETADIGMSKVNEANRVYGMDIQKFNADAQGDILRASAARINPGMDAFTTMLSSATSSAFNYYNYKNTNIRGLSTLRSILGTA